MDPETDLKEKMENENVVMVQEKESSSSISEPEKLESTSLDVDVNIVDCLSLDVDVNIVDCLPTPHQVLQREEMSTCSTDSLSSFGDSDVSIGNVEVESQSEPVVEESEISLKMRKNKLTEHWKKFIQPLMWRSKWLELRLKDLRRRTLRYEKELHECEFQKFHIGSHMAEQFNAKTASFPGRFQQQKIMKRIKRKKCEENSDYKSYIGSHNVFSYLGIDSLCTDTYNIHPNGKGYNKRKQNCEDDVVWDLIDPKDHGSQDGEIFTKIEGIQARVRSLISRVDNLVNENSDYSSDDSQSLPDQSAQFCGLDHHPSEDSGFGSATPLCHILETMLESEDEEPILINNQAAEEEMKNLTNFALQYSDTSHEQSENSGTVVKRPRRTKGIISYRRKNS